MISSTHILRTASGVTLHGAPPSEIDSAKSAVFLATRSATAASCGGVHARARPAWLRRSGSSTIASSLSVKHSLRRSFSRQDPRSAKHLTTGRRAARGAPAAARSTLCPRLPPTPPHARLRREREGLQDPVRVLRPDERLELLPALAELRLGDELPEVDALRQRLQARRVVQDGAPVVVVVALVGDGRQHRPGIQLHHLCDW